MTKVLVCGYGSIGRKHARNLAALGADVYVFRARADASDAVTKDGFGFEADLESGLSWCDAAVVATATDRHIPVALAAARAGKAIYLEKPLSHNFDDVEELLRLSRDLVVEVGCQLRQHPQLKVLKERLAGGEDGRVLAFQAWVGQRLQDWRPGTDYRDSYSADAARGGGALFDLVHEIDLMQWLAGPMTSVQADLRQSGVQEMQAEDLANLLLVAQSGAAGVVQLDMVTPGYRRGLQIVCEKAVYHWDMKAGTLMRDDGVARTAVAVLSPDYQGARMLEDAMAYFLRRIADPALPAVCSLQEASHDLRILLAARAAHESGTRQQIGGGV